MDSLMTTNEVAGWLRTSPETLRWWRHVGRGPVGTKVGKRVLYRPEDVQAYLDACRAADPHSSVSVA